MRAWRSSAKFESDTDIWELIYVPSFWLSCSCVQCVYLKPNKNQCRCMLKEYFFWPLGGSRGSRKLTFDLLMKVFMANLLQTVARSHICPVFCLLLSLVWSPPTAEAPLCSPAAHLLCICAVWCWTGTVQRVYQSFLLLLETSWR